MGCFVSNNKTHFSSVTRSFIVSRSSQNSAKHSKELSLVHINLEISNGLNNCKSSVNNQSNLTPNPNHILKHIRNHSKNLLCFIHVLGEKSFWKKLHIKLRLDLWKGQQQGRDEKTQEHYPSMERWCPPLWPPMQCTCIPISLCTQQGEPGMQVHCVTGQRGGCHHFVLG